MGISLVDEENKTDQEEIVEEDATFDADDAEFNHDKKKRKKVKQKLTGSKYKSNNEVAFFLREADKTGVFLTKAEEAACTRIVYGNYYLILRAIINSRLDNEPMRQLKEAALIRRKRVVEKDEKIDKQIILFFVRGVRDLLVRSGEENNDKINAIKSLAAKVEKMADEIKKTEEIMVKKNLMLVVKIAYKHYGRLPLADLLQEGSIGLMAAVYKHNYRLGFKFSTYACPWVEYVITRAIADKKRTIRIPVNMAGKIARLNKAAKELARTSESAGQRDEIELLSGKTGFTIREVAEFLEMQKSTTVSLGCRIKNGKGMESNTTIGDIIENEQNIPVDLQILHKERVALVKEVLSTLSPRQEAVIRMSFGIGETHEHSLAEIGKKFKVSRERIHQIEKKALNRLRHPVRFNKLKQV